MTEKQLKQHYYDRAVLCAKILLSILETEPEMDLRFIGWLTHYRDKYNEECVLRGEGTEATIKGLPEGSYKPEL